jgi:hypothetical protein
MAFNATFNNVSVILWQTVLLVEENGGIFEFIGAVVTVIVW